MFRVNKVNQSGAASMIIVIFMSIILTIVTIGFLRLALNEQRLATDDDLSVRAYYAAESGIEDARRAIQENLGGTLSDIELNADNCDVPTPARYNAVLSSEAEFDTEFSCMLIDFTPETIRSQMSSANETRQYEINPIRQDSGAASPIEYLTLRWHIDAPQGSDGDGDVINGNFRPAGNRTLLPLANWNGGGHPAMMQVHFISYPGSGNFRRTDIIDSTFLVSPAVSGGAGGPIFTAGGTGVVAGADGDILFADCDDNDGGYACEIRLDMVSGAGAFPTSRQLEVRLTNLYRPTSIEMTMEAPGGAALDFDDAQVVVDVTGRAGGVYRRVEAALDLSTPSLVPDFAIQSAEDICKDFSFTDDPADFGGITNTSCTQP